MKEIWEERMLKAFEAAKPKLEDSAQEHYLSQNLAGLGSPGKFTGAGIREQINHLGEMYQTSTPEAITRNLTKLFNNREYLKTHNEVIKKVKPRSKEFLK